jgi:excisionase family DNA binding protein
MVLALLFPKLDSHPAEARQRVRHDAHQNCSNYVFLSKARIPNFGIAGQRRQDLIGRSAEGGHPFPPRFDWEIQMTAKREPELLTPAEVAAMFRVDPKTVTRWARAGKINSIRTLGGHRRYHAEEIRALLESDEVRFLGPS